MMSEMWNEIHALSKTYISLSLHLVLRIYPPPYIEWYIGMSPHRCVCVYACGCIHDCKAMYGKVSLYNPPAQRYGTLTLGDELTRTWLSSRATKNGECHHLLYSPKNLLIDMDYIMIERHLFDALVRGVRECRSILDSALSAICRTRVGWIDNHSAQTILQRSNRTMQSLRSSGRIGYSIIDGKVFYPDKEIARFLTQSYVGNEREG